MDYAFSKRTKGKGKVKTITPDKVEPNKWFGTVIYHFGSGKQQDGHPYLFREPPTAPHSKGGSKKGKE